MSSNLEARPDGRAVRGERTRSALVEAAVASFREKGYDGTTIRDLAAEVGTSVGSAHYHFASKADLVQELYLRVQLEHRAAASAAMAGRRSIVDRLRAAMVTGLDTLAPFHASAPGFLSAAMSPRSALNPLSPASSAARDVALETFREAVAGSATRLPDDLRSRAPEVAFLGYLLLALYWSYDRSPGTRRARALLEGALGLLGAALPLLRLPTSRPLVRRITRVVDDALPWRGEGRPAEGPPTEGRSR